MKYAGIPHARRAGLLLRSAIPLNSRRLMRSGRFHLHTCSRAHGLAESWSFTTGDSRPEPLGTPSISLDVFAVNDGNRPRQFTRIDGCFCVATLRNNVITPSPARPGQLLKVQVNSGRPEFFLMDGPTPAKDLLHPRKLQENQPKFEPCHFGAPGLFKASGTATQ